MDSDGDKEDEDEITGFSCLGTLRGIAAALVSALAVVVVVMVVTVALRPEKIRLYIDRGYIQSDPWALEEDVLVAKPNLGAAAGVQSDDDPTPLPATATATATVVSPRVEMVSFVRANNVTLRVILRASNPGGRDTVHCTIHSIRILDAAYPNTSTGTELGSIAFHGPNPNAKLEFSVQRQSSHTLRKLVTISDASAMAYLFDQYAYRSSFRATVEVNATVAEADAGASFLPRRRNATRLYICSSVTVSSYRQTAAASDLPCITSEETEWPLNPQTLPPAPAAASNNSSLH